MRQARFGVLGFCALTLAAGLVGGCSSTDSVVHNTAGHGRVQFVMGGPTTSAATAGASVAPMSDGSGRTIASASVTLSSILARNIAGELIDVTVDLPFTVDLVALIQGHSVDLPMGSLPAGSYDQLVVVIRSLHVELSDGTQIDVTPPGGGWTAIVRTEPFDVVEGQVTTVNLHFRADGAFHWEDGHLVFSPGFDCTVDHHDGDDDHEGDDD